MKKTKLEEMREYLQEMESFYAEQSYLHKQAGKDISSEGDKRMSLFCGHLLEKIDS